MKFLIRSFFVVLLLALIPNMFGQSLPEFRPALLGKGPRSLVNLINIESLYKRGQRDAVIMFGCYVTSLGDAGAMVNYRCSANSELLQKEARGQCRQSQFEPAVYHHTRADVWITGTINYFIANGKPHLRIFLNQEDDHLKQGNDFVAPQFTFASGNTKYDGIYWPPGAPGFNGVAAVTLDIDTGGKVLSSKVAYEYPPNMGFGPAMAGPIRDAWFIPGFRNGKIAPCRFTWPLVFLGVGRQMKSG